MPWDCIRRLAWNSETRFLLLRSCRAHSVRDQRSASPSVLVEWGLDCGGFRSKAKVNVEGAEWLADFVRLYRGESQPLMLENRPCHDADAGKRIARRIPVAVVRGAVRVHMSGKRLPLSSLIES